MDTTSLADSVLAFTFSLPEAWEDHPWGDTVAKVGKKVFAFLGSPEADGGIGLSVKLPHSEEVALALPFSEPTGYGLARGHWVSVRAPGDAPLDLLTAWIEESYRAVAPKRLVAQLDAERAAAG